MIPVDIARVSELLGVFQQCAALYDDLASDGDLDTPENLSRIVLFSHSLSRTLEQYLSPNEVLLLVSGIVGILSPGDTSRMYDRLKTVESK